MLLKRKLISSYNLIEISKHMFHRNDDITYFHAILSHHQHPVSHHVMFTLQ